MDPSAIAATASAYSQFSGVLAGLAFTGLVVYLSRGDGKEPNHHIEVWEVAATTFFSLFSLAAAAFLFANLDGMASVSNQGARSAPYSTGALAVDMLMYGIVLALAVLALLYSIVLMVLQYPKTEKMGRYAYWALAVGGTVMVLRFLAQSARDALSVNCGNGNTVCPHGEFDGLLSVPVIWLTLGLSGCLVFLFTIAAYAERREEPRGIVGLFHEKIVAPGLLVFGTTLFVVIGLSLYVGTRVPGYEPSTGSIDTWYIGSILMIALFDLLFGCVVAPRANVMTGEENKSQSRSEPSERERWLAGAANRKLLEITLIAISLALAIAIFILSGPIALWLLVPVAILTTSFLVSVKVKLSRFKQLVEALFDRPLADCSADVQGDGRDGPVACDRAPDECDAVAAQCQRCGADVAEAQPGLGSDVLVVRRPPGAHGNPARSASSASQPATTPAGVSRHQHGPEFCLTTPSNDRRRRGR